MDKLTRKWQRLGWDVPVVMPMYFYGQEVGNMINGMPSVALSLDIANRTNTFSHGLPNVMACSDSPPWKKDDKDGHYTFAIGDNLTPHYKIQSKMGEGTFGQVLEYWDRESNDMVAIKIVSVVKKYREAASIEIEMLEKLGKHDIGGNRCVQIRSWFDYRNHICVVFEKLGPSFI